LNNYNNNNKSKASQPNTQPAAQLLHVSIMGFSFFLLVGCLLAGESS
jgi:hypothetical protein